MLKKASIQIKGVIVESVKEHRDGSGFFAEIFRFSDVIFKSKFAQLSHSMAKRGILKAWHLHYKQTDWMYVVTGNIKLGLYDLRKKSKTYGKLQEIFIGEKYGRKVIKIPPGIAHGYLVISSSMHIIYVADKKYNPYDIITIPPNDPKIGYNWSASKIKK